ncbi:hypothetical protein ACGFWE_27040 [Streptomyces sp. NPDC048523]|uniref:hypothetical protein n=1 Tax=Streptomyces sp. NPDC048523 TaxID=3365567 RepID=UPI003713FACB
MTLWLRATVLAIVVGASATVLPQADRAYGTEPTRPVPAASTSASAATRRSPGSVPAHETLRKPVRPYATGSLPQDTSAAPSDPPSSPEPARESRHSVSSGAPRGHGPERASPSASLAPSPSAATPSRAGSRAGEGRERPGRREEPEAEAENADADGTQSAGTDAGDNGLTAVSKPPPQTAAARPSRPAERPVAGTKVFILPLGTGLVLVGLGLGLGLFALRIRRS